MKKLKYVKTFENFNQINEDCKVSLIDPSTNKEIKTHIISGIYRDVEAEVEKLNKKLTDKQKAKELYWTITHINVG